MKIIKFSGISCPSCRKLEAILKAKGLEVDEEVMVDTSNIEIARRYNVSTLPTLVKVDNDAEVDRLTGLVPVSKIEEFFKE